MRAKKLSSTCFSFLMGGYSLADCFGGGPKLGRGRLMVELCLLRLLPPATAVATVDTLPLLGERPSDSAVWKLPLFLESDCREGLTLEPDEAVCVVKPAGSLTGRVGDLGLGLTNPVPAGEGCNGGGLFTDCALGVLDVEAFVLGVSTFSGCLENRSGVLAGSFGVDASAGLFGALLAVGDFADLPMVLLAEGTDKGFGATLAVVLALGLGVSSLPFAFSFSLPLLVPFAGSVTTLGAELASEDDGFSAAMSVPCFLNLRGELVDASPPTSCTVLEGEVMTGNPGSGTRGDSGIGWFWRLVIGAAFATASAKIFLFSCLAGGVGISVSPLSLRVIETLESWLSPRCSPILPSFSIAMKSVRTLESGRGDSLPITEL